MTPPLKLEGKTALVTGAGRGIGQAIARALAREGAAVAVADIIGENAEAVRAELEAGGRTTLAIRVDLTDESQVIRMVDAVLAAWDHLDILVNNAGWTKMQPFVDSDEESWERILAINFKSVLYTCKAALPAMVARGGGKVVNIGSDAGRVGSTGETVYSGAKGAVIAFSKALAREMARHRITVNVVCPGLTDTALLASSRSEMPKIIEAVTRGIPLQRIAQPEDIAEAVVFLASPAADYITGQALSVSGGLTMV